MGVARCRALWRDGHGLVGATVGGGDRWRRRCGGGLLSPEGGLAVGLWTASSSSQAVPPGRGNAPQIAREL